MRLMESGEMYLETIYILSEKMEKVRAIDVSAYMNFSKPSVSRAIGLLKQGGYLNVEKDGTLLLTPDGSEVARKIYERHRVLTDCLIRLGVDPQHASEDACKIEHDISDQTFEAIKQYVTKLK